LHVPVESDMSFTKLRSELRKCITRLKHAKQSEDARNLIIAQDEQLKLDKEKNFPKLATTCSRYIEKKIVKVFPAVFKTLDRSPLLRSCAFVWSKDFPRSRPRELDDFARR